MPKKETKEKIFGKVTEYLNKYTNILVCEIKDLPANNIHRIRKDLRTMGAEILCGKTVRSFIFNFLINSFNILDYHC